MAVTGGHGIDIVLAPGNVRISCKRGKEIGILVHETYEENLDSIGDIGLSAMNRAAICFSVGQRGYWRKDATNGIIVYLEKAMREGYVFFENHINGIVYGVGRWDEEKQWWTRYINLKLDEPETERLAKIVRF